MPDDLYHHDILAWSRAQADLLRRLEAGERVNDLDWAHVIEEVESVGRSQLQAAQSLFTLALVHALKVVAWPGHDAEMHWLGEIVNFLTQARRRYEPGMAQWLDVPGLYEDALLQVRALPMRVPALPETVSLTPAELADRKLGRTDLIARIRAALPADAP